MVKRQQGREKGSLQKSLVWLHGEVKTPPFSPEARHEAGLLLRFLQAGEQLGMPHAEPLTSVCSRCGALRVRDSGHNYRIMYRIDPQEILILEVYAKKTPKIPKEIIARCKQRLKAYDEIVKTTG